MKIIADTNVLLRLVIRDDEVQREAAMKAFLQADTIAIGVYALCELAWVLKRRYGISRADIAATIRLLVSRQNVVTNRPAVEAGLDLLEAGGDFGDGAIAFEGRWLGGETLVSFDKKAVKLLKAQGNAAELLD